MNARRSSPCKFFWCASSLHAFIFCCCVPWGAGGAAAESFRAISFAPVGSTSWPFRHSLMNLWRSSLRSPLDSCAQCEKRSCWLEGCLSAFSGSVASAGAKAMAVRAAAASTAAIGLFMAFLEVKSGQRVAMKTFPPAARTRKSPIETTDLSRVILRCRASRRPTRRWSPSPASDRGIGPCFADAPPRTLVFRTGGFRRDPRYGGKCDDSCDGTTGGGGTRFPAGLLRFPDADDLPLALRRRTRRAVPHPRRRAPRARLGSRALGPRDHAQADGDGGLREERILLHARFGDPRDRGLVRRGSLNDYATAFQRRETSSRSFLNSWSASSSAFSAPSIASISSRLDAAKSLSLSA